MFFGSRNRVIFVVVLIALVAGLVVYVTRDKKMQDLPIDVSTSTPRQSIVGKSVQNRNLEAYTFGSGSKNVLFVGGVHGGYEWNSVLLAYRFIDHFTANPGDIPAGLSVTIIPSANPDGVFTVTGKDGRFSVVDVSTSSTVLASGRFNANKVDINRNFDCKWQPKSTWRSAEVSAGASAFSEPEAKALRDFIASSSPKAVVFWHSQSNAVYASQCENGILPETLALMNTYASRAGYPAVKTFDAYVTTGAADDWLASVGVPAVTVELSTHESIEWEKNLSGVRGVLERYGL